MDLQVSLSSPYKSSSSLDHCCYSLDADSFVYQDSTSSDHLLSYDFASQSVSTLTKHILPPSPNSPIIHLFTPTPSLFLLSTPVVLLSPDFSPQQTSLTLPFTPTSAVSSPDGSFFVIGNSSSFAVLNVKFEVLFSHCFDDVISAIKFDWRSDNRFLSVGLKFQNHCFSDILILTTDDGFSTVLSSIDCQSYPDLIDFTWQPPCELLSALDQSGNVIFLNHTDYFVEINVFPSRFDPYSLVTSACQSIKLIPSFFVFPASSPLHSCSSVLSFDLLSLGISPLCSLPPPPLSKTRLDFDCPLISSWIDDSESKLIVARSFNKGVKIDLYKGKIEKVRSKFNHDYELVGTEFFSFVDYLQQICFMDNNLQFISSRSILLHIDGRFETKLVTKSPIYFVKQFQKFQMLFCQSEILILENLNIVKILPISAFPVSVSCNTCVLRDGSIIVINSDLDHIHLPKWSCGRPLSIVSNDSFLSFITQNEQLITLPIASLSEIQQYSSINHFLDPNHVTIGLISKPVDKGAQLICYSNSNLEVILLTPIGNHTRLRPLIMTSFHCQNLIESNLSTIGLIDALEFTKSSRLDVNFPIDYFFELFLSLFLT
ncbi:hypothetical protein GEMRC1_004126 [Eukaryota sp. GEM-RC1]